MASTSREEKLEAIARAVEDLALVPISNDDYRDENQEWAIVDTSSAEPDVNWPGELISTHRSKAEARIVRARYILVIVAKEE
jgi:hypothetical protein